MVRTNKTTQAALAFVLLRTLLMSSENPKIHALMIWLVQYKVLLRDLVLMLNFARLTTQVRQDSLQRYEEDKIPSLN